MKKEKTNIMKRTLIAFLALIGLSANSQKVIEETIDHNDQFITIELKFASEIEVKTWDNPQIYLKSQIRTKDGKFEDLYEVDVRENANTISITSKAEPVFKAFEKEWKRNNPGNKKGYYNSGNLYEIQDVVFIPKNARFKLSSINGHLKSEIIEGDFTADLINGDIEITKYSGNFDLSTINGEIDLKMINTDLVAETINGEIYADEKLKLKAADRNVGQKISGRTQEGKNNLRLNTINGNMYLRL